MTLGCLIRLNRRDCVDVWIGVLLAVKAEISIVGPPALQNGCELAVDRAESHHSAIFDDLYTRCPRDRPFLSANQKQWAASRSASCAASLSLRLISRKKMRTRLSIARISLMTLRWAIRSEGHDQQPNLFV